MGFHNKLFKTDLEYFQFLAKSYLYLRGPKNLSPLKCIRWSGESAIHTSVSQAKTWRYFLMIFLSGNAVTKTKLALLLANKLTSSSYLRPSIGPLLVTL